MKNAGTYKSKIAKLLKALPKAPQDADVEPVDPIYAVVIGILEADASAKMAGKAIEAINKEYVDFNELRVSPARDIVECIGEDYPDAHGRAEMLRKILGGIFEQSCSVSLEYLAKLPKRDVRRRLSELGLNEYASGVAMLRGMNMHAVPMDRDLAECLEMDGLVHPGSSAADVQGFVERAVPKQLAHAAHEFLRQYVAKNADALAKRHKAAAQAAAKAAEEAEKQAAEEAKEAAEKEAAAKKKAAAKERSSARKRRSAKGKAAKRTTRKTAGKTAKKATKRAAKKTVKKTAKRAAKKTTKQAAKKVARKITQKKTRGKSTRKKT